MKNFYSDKGITATSAEHICNMAKEHYETIEQEIKNFCFYNTEIELLTSGKKVLISKGVESSDILFLQDKIKEIADCKTLIAYLREAIKDKTRISQEIKFPEELELPTRPAYTFKLPTTQDVLDTWTAEKLLRYFKLEAYAATYGEQVHRDGDISKARKSFYEVLTKPNSVNLDGSDTIISTYTPTLDKSEVERQYFLLQAKQREAQAELNGLKQEIEDEISRLSEKGRQDYESLMNTYEDQRLKIENQRALYLEKKRQEIKNLKIVIPENLKSIYDKINSLSKK